MIYSFICLFSPTYQLYSVLYVAHILTWYVEECGPGLMADMPYLIELQNTILNISSIKSFIRSSNYYPIGDDAYCKQVCQVLGRKI